MPGDADRGPERFNEFLAYDVVAWRQGYAELTVPIRPVHLNAHDVVHGGVIASLLDVVLGLAGGFGRPGGAASTVTLSLSTAFVKPARGATLRCTGQRTGGGRTVYMARGEVVDEDGDLVATAEGVFRYVAQRTPASGSVES